MQSLFKVSNKRTKTTLLTFFWCLLLTLNRFHTLFSYLYCWLWTNTGCYQTCIKDPIRCAKSVQLRSFFGSQGYDQNRKLFAEFFWSAFSRIRTEYRKIRTRNHSVFGHFSRSVSYRCICQGSFNSFLT